MNGWNPAGTTPRDFDWYDGTDWSEQYCAIEYQTVSSADAAAIADALERALPDIPDHDCEPRVWGDSTGYHEKNATPREWFSGLRKQHVRKFIRYCRAGSFCIG